MGFRGLRVKGVYGLGLRLRGLIRASELERVPYLKKIFLENSAVED